MTTHQDKRIAWASPTRRPDDEDDVEAAKSVYAYRATTEIETTGDTVYLWPERYKARWYLEMKMTMGAQRFEAEMNGFPVVVGVFFEPGWFPTYDELPDRPEDSRLYRQVLMQAATETTTEAVQEGKVSPMQFAVGFVENSDDRQTGLARILEEMRYEAFIGLVKGSPGTGKTATAINLAHAHAIHNGAEIATNISSWTAAH